MQRASLKTSQSNSSTKEVKGLGIRITYDSEGNGKVQAIVRDFPLPQWEEWWNDCKKNFGGERWTKIINDHQKAKMFDLMIKGQANAEIEKEEKDVCLGGEEIKE